MCASARFRLNGTRKKCGPFDLSATNHASQRKRLIFIGRSYFQYIIRRTRCRHPRVNLALSSRPLPSPTNSLSQFSALREDREDNFALVEKSRRGNSRDFAVHITPIVFVESIEVVEINVGRF